MSVDAIEPIRGSRPERSHPAPIHDDRSALMAEVTIYHNPH